jgi:hypothetical protein
MLGAAMASTLLAPPPTPKRGGDGVRRDSAYLMKQTVKRTDLHFGANNLTAGGADQRTKYQAILDALGDNETAFTPWGDYYMSGDVRSLYGANKIFAGDGWNKTRWLATTTSSTHNFEGHANVSVRDMGIIGSASGRDNTGNNKRGFMSFNCDGVTFDGLNVEKVADAAIFIDGNTGGQNTRNFSVTGSRVKGNYSDGIHMTVGAANGTVRKCHVEDTGDDCISSIGTGAQNSNIDILENNCLNSGSTTSNTSAGIAISGTATGRAIGNLISRSGGASIRLDNPSGYPMPNETNVMTQHNEIRWARTINNGHPVILSYTNGTGYIRSTTIDQNYIIEPYADTMFQFFGANSTYDVQLTVTGNTGVGSNLTTKFNLGSFQAITQSGNTMNGV